MKKFIAAVMACLIICAVFAGCSDPLKERNASSSAAADSSQTDETEAETEKETETATEEEKTYKNTIDGLGEYLIDRGFLSGKNDTVKNASEIGAKESRFYNSKKGTVELYYYTDAIPENVKSSVEKDHTLTLYGKTVKNVYITESNKYLMVYNDSAASDTNSENYKLMMKCVDAFNKFESVAEESDSKKSEKSETKSKTEKTEKSEKAE